MTTKPLERDDLPASSSAFSEEKEPADNGSSDSTADWKQPKLMESFVVLNVDYPVHSRNNLLGGIGLSKESI